MYKNFQNVDLTIYEESSNRTIDRDSASFLKIKDVLNDIATIMDEEDGLQEEWLDSIGINCRSSFAGQLDDMVFEYLVRVEFKKRRLGIRLTSIAYSEHGSDGEDHVMITIGYY